MSDDEYVQMEDETVEVESYEYAEEHVSGDNYEYADEVVHGTPAGAADQEIDFSGVTSGEQPSEASQTWEVIDTVASVADTAITIADAFENAAFANVLGIAGPFLQFYSFAVAAGDASEAVNTRIIIRGAAYGAIAEALGGVNVALPSQQAEYFRKGFENGAESVAALPNLAEIQEGMTAVASVKGDEGIQILLNKLHKVLAKDAFESRLLGVGPASYGPTGSAELETTLFWPGASWNGPMG